MVAVPTVIYSVAEPPLFPASLAPDVRNPRYRSRLRPNWVGSRRFRLPTLKFLFCKKLIINTSPFLDHIYFYKLLLSHVLHKNKAFLFCLPKIKGAGGAEAALKRRLWLRASTNKKNRLRLWSRSKSGGSFRNTGYLNCMVNFSWMSDIKANRLL